MTLQRDWPALASLCAAVILITPIWCVDWPAIPDYAAHFAGYYLISGGAHAALLKPVYRIEWAPIPNLAAEIIVPSLGTLVPLMTATKMFVSAIVASWVAGPALVHRAVYGRFGVTPLISATFAYNGNLMWGFLNYCFGAGLCLIVFAAWIWTERYRGPVRLVAFALATTIIYFCHLFAAALLLLLIGCFEVGSVIVRRQFDLQSIAARLGAMMALSLPSAVAFQFKPVTDGESDIGFNIFETALDRVDAALQRYFNQPSYVLLIILLVSLVAALLTRRAALHKMLWFPLIVLAMCAVLAPESAMGGWGVDLRLPAVLCSLIFAATEPRMAPRAAGILAAAILTMLAFNASTLAGNWLHYDAQVREFRTALDDVPPGSRLFTVLDSDAIGENSDEFYWHMAEISIVDRQAFTTLMFATKGQHVVQLMAPYDKLASISADEGSPPDVTELDNLANGRSDDDDDIKTVFPYLMYFQCHFDEAIVIHLGGKRTPVPSRLRVRHLGSFFTLYDVADTANCADR